MRVLPNMSLVSWNNPQDKYNREQLAGNFAKLDYHDHSAGKGVKIGSSGIEKEAIGELQLGASAVSEAKIKDEAVTVKKITKGAFVQQETGVVPSFMSWGIISKTGTIEAGSGDFTAVKVGPTGNFEIKFNKAKSNEKYGVVVAPTELLCTAASFERTTAKFNVGLETNGGSPVPVNTAFAFIVVAPT